MVHRFVLVLGFVLMLVVSTSSVATAQGSPDQPPPAPLDPNPVQMAVKLRVHGFIHPQLQEHLPPEVLEVVHAVVHERMMSGMEMGAS